MPINYFNEDPASGPDINEVLEEVEYQLTGNKVSKLSDPSGGKVLVSTVGGDMQESKITPNTISGKVSKIPSPTGDKIVLSKADGEVKESALTVGDITNKISKMANPKDISTWLDKSDGYIIVSDGAGGVKEGRTSQNGFITRMSGYISDIDPSAGDKIVLSKADGEIKESALTVGDITNKIPKITSPTGGKIVISKTNGGVEESTLSTVRLYSQLRRKSSLEKVNFINNVGYLLLMDRRITYTTTFRTFIFDAKIKSGQESKVKKFKIMYSADGTNYSTIQEHTIEANKNYKELTTNFTLSPQMLYNFKVEIDNVTNLGDVFDFLRVEWYYTEG